MEKESKKKKEKTFFEELFYSMMQAVLRAAINDMINNLFGDLEITGNREAWIDSMIEDDSILGLIDDAVQNMNDEFSQDSELSVF